MRQAGRPFHRWIAKGALALALITAQGSWAQAAGDPVEGEKVSKKCTACHAFEADGASKLGPNLFGVMGRTIAGVDGYAFSDSYVALGQQGKTWTAEAMAAYLKNPRDVIREWTGDPKAKSKMTFKLPDDADGANLIAYLEGLK